MGFTDKATGGQESTASESQIMYVMGEHRHEILMALGGALSLVSDL